MLYGYHTSHSPHLTNKIYVKLTSRDTYIIIYIIKGGCGVGFWLLSLSLFKISRNWQTGENLQILYCFKQGKPSKCRKLRQGI